MRAQPALTRPFLHAGLLAAVLALIAGVLGMHIVMTGGHTSQAATSITRASLSESAAHGTPGGQGSHAPISSAAAGTGTVGQAQCSCSGNCPSEHVMAGSCIPSLATGSLTAPLPDATAAPASTVTALQAQACTRWSYRPGSPSPGELSISRT
ncbi:MULTISPECIES: DUF6153 family protein [Paenarthrobacter]|uniref:DUF6153 family protein n=1 Tax=Paenarthrobacter TaxID=1742992 RepID=UPI001878D4CF|nr:MULTISPECIES: DUF6153 family protein [Paenarthrobacter]QOT19777.1 hypothetical protein HMI59_24275 [Paenarthrobacter sp. YJN-5]UOD83364.1 DUF6153 family protein [Paenarthrobacter ureafaciens]WNZ04307.1 DUF6153 family protein [Paenarthrobacter ureafaciens]